MTGEMDGEPQEDILDRCIQRLLQGEPLDRVLRSYPDQQPQLRTALEPALALLRSNTPEPSPHAQYAAMNAMMRQVHTEAERPELPGVFRWLGTLRARPLAFQALAVVAAIAVFSSIGLGASAATGTAPEPVRNFLGISSNSMSVRMTGPIISLRGGMLMIHTAAGDRSIEITSATTVRRGANQIDVTGLLNGETVLVTATEMRDGTLVARDVRAADLPTPTNTAIIGVPALPQSDDTATGTPSEEPAGGDDRRDDGTSSTPVPGDRHDDGEHAGTPEVSATSKSDDEHATRTPDHGDTTSEPEHHDSTSTPTSGDGGDSEHHD